MKTIFLICIIIFIAVKTFSQERKNYSEIVLNFVDVLYDNSISEDKEYNINYTFNSEQAQEILHKYYRAVTEDPLGLINYMEEEYELIRNRALQSGKNSTEKRFAVRKKNLSDELSKIYGEEFMEIIDTPYYLRIKIIDKSKSQYISPGPPERKYRTNKLTAIIEEVIKGENQFTKANTISIEYMTWWFANSLNKFEPGSSYFIPLRPWTGTAGFLGWRPNFLPDDNYAIYEIENEIVSTLNNYFDIGTMTEWARFKEIFIQKYVLFK
ncbi:MAG: hypothetical protein O6940_07710 [Ignavibacteria bacterium]|nr:hypothetical protein [Ignavibacteria bacterium]